MDYIEGKLPEREAVRRLYDDAGWIAYTCDMDALERALRASLYLVCAYDGDALCGLLRAVGDGQTILYIQDILVLQQYRRHGIGQDHGQDAPGRLSQRAPARTAYGRNPGDARVL